MSAWQIYLPEHLPLPSAVTVGALDQCSQSWCPGPVPPELVPLPSAPQLVPLTSAKMMAWALQAAAGALTSWEKTLVKRLKPSQILLGDSQCWSAVWLGGMVISDS